MSRKASTENGAGCLVVIALGLICWGAVSLWGGGALLVIGLVIFILLILG